MADCGYQAGDLLITKRQWGAFYGTRLDQQLRRKGVRTIVIGGVATNFGVESTARVAYDRGFELVFGGAIRAWRELHGFAVRSIFRGGTGEND